MKETKKRMKLLRVCIIAILSCSKLFFLIIKDWNMYYPISNLLHYVIGTGEDIVIEPSLVNQSKSAFIESIKRNNFGNSILGGEYAIDDSKLYEGSGFYDRPILFYMMGRFVFDYEPRTGVIKASDIYDWHSQEKDGRHFTSPLGNNKLLLIIGDIAGRLFGYDLFIVPGKSDYSTVVCTDKESLCISNKLWQEIGGKSFTSHLEGKLTLSKKEKQDIVASHREYKTKYARLKYISKVVKNSVERKEDKHFSKARAKEVLDGIYRITLSYGDIREFKFATVDDNHVVTILRGKKLYEVKNILYKQYKKNKNKKYRR